MGFRFQKMWSCSALHVDVTFNTASNASQRAFCLLALGGRRAANVAILANMKNLKTAARVQIVQFPHHSSCRLVKLFTHILKMACVILHFTAQWWKTIQCMCLWNLFCWAFPRINLYSTFTLCIFLHWKICQVELICYHRVIRKLFHVCLLGPGACSHPSAVRFQS